MTILWWLVPAVVATLAAMVYVGLTGREQRPTQARTEAEQAKLAAAMQRPHPGRQVPAPRPARPDDRSTGVAVRRKA